jgi:hypothetical protein
MMRLLLAVAALAGCVLTGAPAQAQAIHTWVAANGDDAMPCSRTAPCKTFAGAISKTSANGEINCVDAAGYGAVTITKTITIDCGGAFGRISAGTLTVNGSQITVHIRNLTIDGGFINGIGVNILNASKVNLENVVIRNHTQQGVRNANSTSGSMLVIQDSVISNNQAAGVSCVGATGSGVLLHNVVSKQNQYGLALGNGYYGIVQRSNMSNNWGAGLEADPGGNLVVDDTMLNNNNIALQISGTATMSNTTVVYNTTAFSGSGTINTFGNNRTVGNVTLGKTLVAMGGATTDLGQK